IDHPNVAQILDVGEFMALPYFVMELIDGEPLSVVSLACQKARLQMPLGFVLRVLADTCRGLHAAHDLRDRDGRLLGLVHRDVSPPNIIVDASGVSKLIDFGVAKVRDRTVQTNAGTLKGKVNYMPREQAAGGEVDRRVDTWAVGAVLYTLLCG